MQSPKALGLSRYAAWRPGQARAIRRAATADTPHVLIQAATGSGKSLIAAALTQLDARRAVVLTATKGLMGQYAAQFAQLYDVRGMSNYECLAASGEHRRLFAHRRGTIDCAEGPCHTGSRCTLKDEGCLYFDRRRKALTHGAVLTNYSYWLSQRRYAHGLGHAQLLICDEAHACADQLMMACRLEVPRHLVDARRMPATHRAWRDWAEAHVEELEAQTQDDARLKRSRLLDTLKALRSIDAAWAWDADGHTLIFEPTVPRLLLPLLFTNDGKTTVVHLSATATRETLGLVGISPSDVTVHEMPSRFPVSRRPIYLVPGARMRYGMSQSEVASWMTANDAILGMHADRKGLMHTVSYRRQQEIRDLSAHAHRMICPTARSLDADLARFYALPPASGAVLVSPVLMTGYDFPGTKAEYQIITKMPFPDTRSRIMKARIAATPGYRDHATMQAFVQACGRPVRSETDLGATYCTDEMARWFLEKHAALAPAGFMEAVYRTQRLPGPLPKLDPDP